MIKTNTLPNLPDIYKQKEDKKKKKKKLGKMGKYYVHVETSNKSFLKMYKTLGMLKIENRDFFLALYDKSLRNVDPFDPNLDQETKLRIVIECKNNLWYFLRECVRIVGDGGTNQYKLHRGNLALTWCLLNNIDFFLELSRQNGKSISVDCGLLWLYNFGTTNATILMMNKDHAEAKSNLARIREMRSALPEYMRFDTKFNADNKELKILENKEDAINPKTHNKIITKPCATSKEKADKLGRGMTSSIQWYDEFAFLAYNMIIYTAASPAAGEAGRFAEEHGKPHCKMITTTPGDMQTDAGRDCFEFRNLSCPFTEDWYDWDINEVKKFIEYNSTNGFTVISFSYKQLGRDEKYFQKCVSDLGGNWFKVRREVLLEWVCLAEDSPFEAEDLERLKSITYSDDIAQKIRINKYFELKLYEQIPANIPIILSCDVGSGGRRDFSTIAVINSRTKQCIGEFCNNKVDTVDFADIIYTIAKRIIKNSLIVVERNNVGHAVLANLVRTDIKSRIYYEVMNDELQEKVKNGYRIDNASDSRNFGIWTNELRRDQMMELLTKFVANWTDRVRTPILALQIAALVFNKKGRIDHTPNGHDDMVMGYLLGIWVLYYGKNIQKYGIIRMPDVDPNTGMTEDEVFALEEYKEIQKQEKMREIERQIQSDVVSDENSIFNTRPRKTINDFYKQLDMEKSRAMGFEGAGEVSINEIIKPSENNLLYGQGTLDLIHGNITGSGDDNFGSQMIDSILGGDF